MITLEPFLEYFYVMASTGHRMTTDPLLSIGALAYEDGVSQASLFHFSELMSFMSSVRAML